MTLTLNAVIHFFSQDTLAYDDVSSDQVWLPGNQQFREYSRKSHILITWAFTVTLALKIAIDRFTLALKLHHHTKFGNKMFCDSENIIKQHIPFFHMTLQLVMLYYQTKSDGKLTSNLEDTTEIVIFWLYKPSLWPWHWTQWTNFSAWYFGLWCCISIPGLATKCSVVQKIWSGHTFTDILNLRCDLERRSPIFPQDTLAYDAVLSNQIWL